jgi:hypothetical protein
MDCQTTGNAIHPLLSFWLDVFVKVVAVALGGLWTFWNYLKSRPYSQRLDLQIEGDVLVRNGLYVDVNIVLKNLGGAKHNLQAEGTSCDLILVHADLSEESVRLFPVFVLHNQIEPGESINDRILWHIADPPNDLVWLRVNLRVVSGKIEWNSTSIVPVNMAD